MSLTQDIERLLEETCKVAGVKTVVEIDDHNGAVMSKEIEQPCLTPDECVAIAAKVGGENQAWMTEMLIHTFHARN